VASYLLIVNPVAGKGAGSARAAELRERLDPDHAVDLVSTTSRGHATRLAREHGADVDGVIAIGGDGTLNEALVGVLGVGASADTRPALGFLPGGTANVATKAFGFMPEPRRLADALPHLEGRLVDVGIADFAGQSRPFLQWCGAGIDAVVIDELNSARIGHLGRRGIVLKAPRVIASVARYPAPSVHVVADGQELASAASVIVANVAEVAFGGTLHSGATPFDGEIDVVTIEQAGPFRTAHMAAYMMLASLTSSPDVGHRTATTVTMRSEGRVPVQIDGEPVGHLPIHVRVEKAAVRLLVKDGGPSG
jgi:diacylglycerol kinase family enzyme